MYGPQFATLTSSDIPLPLVLKSCGEFVGVMTPHSAEKVGVTLLPPDAAPSRARAAPGRRSRAVAARAAALLRMVEVFMGRSIGAARLGVQWDLGPRTPGRACEARRQSTPRTSTVASSRGGSGCAPTTASTSAVATASAPGAWTGASAA